MGGSTSASRVQQKPRVRIGSAFAALSKPYGSRSRASGRIHPGNASFTEQLADRSSAARIGPRIDKRKRSFRPSLFRRARRVSTACSSQKTPPGLVNSNTPSKGGTKLELPPDERFAETDPAATIWPPQALQSVQTRNGAKGDGKRTRTKRIHPEQR